jgi:hypothetical protein
MTDIDVLVLGRHVLLKTEQRNQMTAEERAQHLKQFELD